MVITIVKTNFDINVWDKVAYETDYEHSGGWQLQAHLIEVTEHNPFGTTGEMVYEPLVLRAGDIAKMRLGEEPDTDYWVDAQTMLDDERTPRKVRRWIHETLDLIWEARW